MRKKNYEEKEAAKVGKDRSGTEKIREKSKK